MAEEYGAALGRRRGHAEAEQAVEPPLSSCAGRCAAPPGAAASGRGHRPGARGSNAGTGWSAKGSGRGGGARRTADGSPF